jgi:hypothetical protein
MPPPAITTSTTAAIRLMSSVRRLRAGAGAPG